MSLLHPRQMYTAGRTLQQPAVVGTDCPKSARASKPRSRFALTPTCPPPARP